jgi:L-fuconolactonase
MLARRDFLAGVSAATVVGALPACADFVADIPIIDCHIHLFDGSRPQSAPYKGPQQYQKESGGIALPAMYRKIAEPLGIVGVMEVDASPWVEDNLWVLETIQPEPFMVGTIGDLQPDKPEFSDYLGRYAKNPLFRGIRYGNIFGYNLVAQADNPAFIDGLKLLARHDLVLETANQTVALLQAAVKVSDKVPDLRIVLDHLPALDPSPANKADYDSVLKQIAQRPKIWAKLSEIVHPVRMDAPGGGRGGAVVTKGLKAHKERLDTLMGYLGEDRVVFGSDWPNAVGVSELPETVALVREYFSTKSRAAAEKYFWKNSIAAYKWVRRSDKQPSLA